MFNLEVTKSTQKYLGMTCVNGYILRCSSLILMISLFCNASSLSTCNLQAMMELWIYHRPGLGNIERKWHYKTLDEGMKLMHSGSANWVSRVSAN
jgi:hypothetical protein